MLSHGAVASRVLGKDVVHEAFADWTKARVRPQVKATLGMLARLTCEPLDFGPADIAPPLEAGVTPAGIEQAVGVGYIFSYQNRMADAMGADIAPDQVERAGEMLSLPERAMASDRLAKGREKAYAGAIPAQVEAMVESVTQGPGDADVALRAAVFRRGMAQLGFPETETDVPASLAYYVDTVARHAAEITDQDVQDLLAAGWSEPEVFEVSVAASTAAAYGRLKIAWAALAQAQRVG
jgi:alkylhydroperoxidase family enzyme